jgi:hypothetical protein
MHESMLYKINENDVIKQNSSEVDNGLDIDNLDIFDF